MSHFRAVVRTGAFALTVVPSTALSICLADYFAHKSLRCRPPTCLQVRLVKGSLLNPRNTEPLNQVQLRSTNCPGYICFCNQPACPTSNWPADKSSSTSEFLKAFGVLLEEPERAGVVGRCACCLYRPWHVVSHTFLCDTASVGGTGTCGRSS